MRTWFVLPVLYALITTFPARADEVRIGVLAFQGSERAVRDWEPTRKHLEGAVPPHRFSFVPLNHGGMAEAIAQGRVDFVITNPGHYVELETRFGVTRLATAESQRWGSPTAAIGSTVIAREGRSDLVDLADLEGKSLAVVGPGAFGGFQVIWREMAEIDVDPLQDLREIRNTGFPMERVVWMVRDGAADAGVLRSCLLEELIAEGKVAPNEFQVVGRQPTPGLPCATTSRLYPDWPFAKTAASSHALGKQVAAALLTMPLTDSQAWTAPLDYSPVHDLMRDLTIGPYADRGQVSLLDLASTHWQWLAVGLLAALWWVAHVARVEALVRRRTAELEREIAERAKAERNADRHREERDQFSRLGILGEMASNIAHELNQPLSAIMNYSRGMTRMMQSGGADPALLSDGAQAIAGQAERAAAIIERIRGFVRRREARREDLNLNDVVTETMALFEGLAGRRGIAVHIHLADNPPLVSADGVEIQQVLLNLLQNAVDAMAGQPQGGDITVRTSVDGNMVKVAVRDSGPGLSPEAEARLFEPFFTTKREGLGLGLSICRTIIESHGGRLWAAPNDGAGLTVRFSLPMTKARA